MRARTLVLGVAVALASVGCTRTVEGWSVSCQTFNDVCDGVAAVALNNLAFARPAEPTGVIEVRVASQCPEVPEWADDTTCWEARIPLGGGETACLVLARRPELGGFGQVGGDRFAGPPPRDGEDMRPGCP